MNLDTALLRTALEKLKPIAGQVSDRFYENLWNDYPQTKGMFHGSDMGPQKFAFFQSLSYIIDNVDKPDDLQPFLRGLGGAHVAYGVQDQHYSWVGAALSKTIAQFLGEMWTEALAREWANFFQMVSSLMMEGAGDHTRGVHDNPLEKVRHLQTLVGDPAPMPPPAAAAAPAAEAIQIPADVQEKIRSEVRVVVRRFIKREIDKIAREELDTLTKKAA